MEGDRGLTSVRTPALARTSNTQGSVLDERQREEALNRRGARRLTMDECQETRPTWDKSGDFGSHTL